MPFNISATVNILRALKNPALLYPQCTISTFDQLPIPLSKAFKGEPEIRAVVLDKDNCFALPHALEVYPAYNVGTSSRRRGIEGAGWLKRRLVRSRRLSKG
jgi:phosphatidylglycerophosphatase GEP4